MRQRIVTGICLIALLAAFVYLGGWWLRAAVLLLVALSMHEMYAAFRHKGLRPVPVGMALPVLLLVAEIFVAEASRMEAAMAALVLLSAVGVAVVVLSGRAEGERMYATIVPLIYPGAFYILLFSLLRGDEMETTLPLVLMFLVPSMNDCFALFAGLALGKHKLAPQISPKKTVEGAIGGLIAAVVLAMVLPPLVCAIGRVSAQQLRPMWQYALFGLASGVLSQVGDLVASLVKRDCGIKDFGKIFPGHGGVMDRLDGILFAALACYLFFGMMG